MSLDSGLEERLKSQIELMERQKNEEIQNMKTSLIAEQQVSLAYNQIHTVANKFLYLCLNVNILDRNLTDDVFRLHRNVYLRTNPVGGRGRTACSLCPCWHWP